LKDDAIFPTDKANNAIKQY